MTLTISGFAAWGKCYSGQITGTGLWGNRALGWSTGVAGGKGASIAGMLTYSYYVRTGNVLPVEYQKMYEELLKTSLQGLSGENANEGYGIEGYAAEGYGGGGE